jgi:cysteine-rich repeat protein
MPDRGIGCRYTLVFAVVLGLVVSTNVCASICGDAVVDPGEQCDDGNVTDGDCCSSTCQLESAGSQCPGDGDACTSDHCDGAGVCQHVVIGSGGDPDGDGVCASNDNCPATSNSDQADLDGDGVGDLCDPADAVIRVDRVRLQATRGGVPPSGTAKAKGRFLTALSGDVFDPLAGVTVRVADALGVDLTHGFTSCIRRSYFRVVRCDDGDFHADFKFVGDTLASLRFAVRFVHQPLTSPFQGPATVTITHGAAIDRAGSAVTCRGEPERLICRTP